MALERKWQAVPARPFTADGTSLGVATISDTAGFYTKSKVSLQSDTLQPIALQVLRVLSATQLLLGPVTAKIGSNDHADISAYLASENASVSAGEQDKSQIPDKDHYLAVYESDPIVADRVVNVDKRGEFVDTVKDNAGVNRLAVDGQFHAEVDVQVDVDVDGVYNPVTNPDPDTIANIGHTRSNPTNATHQIQRQTAKRGTSDTDTVSADVAIHDHNGNKFDERNPLPVTGSFEKFFEVIAASKWMDEATYDEVVPTYSAGNSVLTLTYKEDGAVLGDAVITYTSLNSWSIKLTRYIDEDDGTPLQDDDGTALNLD